MKYKDYLRSNTWLQIRLDILKIKGFKCERCDKKYSTKSLQVHHLSYERLGKEEPEDLEVLCKGCHATEHGLIKGKKKKKKAKKSKMLPFKDRAKNDRWEKMRRKFGFQNI